MEGFVAKIHFGASNCMQKSMDATSFTGHAVRDGRDGPAIDHAGQWTKEAVSMWLANQLRCT